MEERDNRFGGPVGNQMTRRQWLGGTMAAGIGISGATFLGGCATDGPNAPAGRDAARGGNGKTAGQPHGAGDGADEPTELRGDVDVKQIFGKDDRKRIKRPERFPYHAIAMLDITLADGWTRMVGSGFFVNDRITVVTSAHNLFPVDPKFKDNAGKAVKAITVYPGRNGGPVDGFPAVAARAFTPHPNWARQDAQSYKFDYGVIKVRRAPNVTPLDFEPYADRTTQVPAFVSGYPDGPQKTAPTGWEPYSQHMHGDLVIAPGSDLFLGYKIDTSDGQSGSPLWMIDGGEVRPIGIHKGVMSWGSSGTLNTAVRITADVVAWVNAQLADVKETD